MVSGSGFKSMKHLTLTERIDAMRILEQELENVGIAIDDCLTIIGDLSGQYQERYGLLCKIEHNLIETIKWLNVMEVGK